ncbi:MAG: hypothetical protein RL077_4425 [Verrucomicrobiota bacterium]|jgi:hypothetical protein
MRLQKALDQINVLPHRAVTAITGETGLAILDKIIAGERDPQNIAAHRRASPRIATTAAKRAWPRSPPR